MLAKQLRSLVVEPTLKALEAFNPKLNTPAAVNLLLGTCAQESDMGHFLKQVGGPALGLYQIEPATHKDIVDRYLNKPGNAQLRNLVTAMTSRDTALGDDSQLITNLRYATAICRIRYWYETEPMPAADDIKGLAAYWNDHYNGNPEVGTVEEFMDSYARYVKD